MSRKQPDQDISFSDAMQDVTPHRHERADITSAADRDRESQRYRRAAALREEALVVDGLSDEKVDRVGAEESLLFALPGVQHRLIQRLKQGHVPWDEGLDLHGYTVDQARDMVSQFVRDARRNQLRCLLLVHGKAHGNDSLLKSYVNEWLRRLPEVLAFCSAQPADGGNGALYILLKR